MPDQQLSKGTVGGIIAGVVLLLVGVVTVVGISFRYFLHRRQARRQSRDPPRMFTLHAEAPIPHKLKSGPGEMPRPVGPLLPKKVARVPRLQSTRSSASLYSMESGEEHQMWSK
ncbi:hypothetical protein B0H11DRAFT_1903832 [Mycena galericulata]|nr:hypothetical protein B0H11DRAFT_1903832 [Mycena galericulata]